MNNEIQYRFQKMALEQFAILNTSVEGEAPVVGFQTEVQFGFDVENKVLKSQISLVMQHDETLLVKAVLSCYFMIAPECVERMVADGKLVFNQPILIQFASFCYGALRGVLFAKTAETGLERFVLPPLYFQEIIHEPFVVEV